MIEHSRVPGHRPQLRSIQGRIPVPREVAHVGGLDLVEERVPEFRTEKVAGKLPTAREIADNQYEFATRMAKVTHEFALAVIGALEPVTEKVVKPAEPKTKSTTRKAA